MVQINTVHSTEGWAFHHYDISRIYLGTVRYGTKETVAPLPQFNIYCYQERLQFVF